MGRKGGGSSHCGLKRLDRPSTRQLAWSLESEVRGQMALQSERGQEHSSD